MNGDKELEKIEGTVEHITFKNEENGYAVVEIEVADAEYETIFGTLPFITEGETVCAYGTFTVSPKYGRQFKVEYYEKQLPKTEAMTVKYLSSGTVRGIGPVMAKKIVEKFGAQTFDVIENNPDWLTELPGISASKAKSIGEAFRAQHGLRAVMTYCRDFFPPSTAVKVFKRYGASALDVIKTNPYSLCDGTLGVSFERADAIAHTSGLDPNCAERIYAGLKFILEHNAAQNGHTYIPEEKLLKAADVLMKTEQEPTQDALDMLVKTDICRRERVDGRKCIYLSKYYEAEKYVCEKLRMLEENTLAIDADNLKSAVDLIEVEEGIRYAPMQRKAIEDAANSGVMVLTGGPGTGKTTVIRAVIRIFSRLGFKFALAAPTGRAAKRMSEATSHEAKTIHRLLEAAYTDGGDELTFMRGRNNLLEETAIIVDEASMIDILLMKSLLEAIKNGAKLILIGDADQLPSVGAGNVLADIINSEAFNIIHLTEIFRQAKESLIVTNAHTINAGKYPDLHTKNNDFFFMSRPDDVSVASTVVELCKTRLPKKYGAEVLESLQVITPTRMGCAGTEGLNISLQAALNPPSPSKREKKARGVVFREGDKVMQTRNNYDITWVKYKTEGSGIFNGDIGCVQRVENNNERLIINFDERITEYDYSLLDDLEHAYAVTVHKSQGSEYKTVIIPVFKFSKRLLTRNLLYTAVTRAQSMVIIVGSEEVVDEMVDNNRHAMRYTSLAQRLRDFGQ